MKGEFVHVTEDESGAVKSSECEINVQTLMPNEGECQFIPNENQDDVTTSLMSLQYLDYVGFHKLLIAYTISKLF